MSVWAGLREIIGLVKALRGSQQWEAITTCSTQSNGITVASLNTIEQWADEGAPNRGWSQGGVQPKPETLHGSKEGGRRNPTGNRPARILNTIPQVLSRAPSRAEKTGK